MLVTKFALRKAFVKVFMVACKVVRVASLQVAAPLAFGKLADYSSEFHHACLPLFKQTQEKKLQTRKGKESRAACCK